ncbi:adenylate kinase [Cavenderia fasciculata]|uniref:Adenylate kinase n=1 Tax=Cavenderia fasciculata TaxID=261658 RepID=F4PSZ7_CACFS|nr:adenylate kinase [Cavenderia fasciculata]EGG20786.1 adenylate kinase [Cavenderia fasciculata]|eukprot:XP_004358636.1 adenylate kinase [Cavenderia fasciculata]
MLAKGASHLVSEVIATSTRLTQRRASIELQKSIQEGSNTHIRRNSICGPCSDGPADLHPPTNGVIGGSGHSTAFTSLYHTSKPILPDIPANDSFMIPTILENGNPICMSYKQMRNPIKEEESLFKQIQSRRRASLDDFVGNGTKTHRRRYSYDGLPSKRMENISEISIGDISKLNLNSTLKQQIKENNVVDIDAKRTFDQAWGNLVRKYGVQNLNLPKDVTWLLGGPGAGKGTNTAILQSALGIESKPIVMSSLLNSDECQALKKSGKLVNDTVVLEMLLKEITKPDIMGVRSNGIIIDGFPRNAKQTRFVEMLYDKIVELRQRINPNASLPKFRITVLHVSEKESVSRQLGRGLKALQENEKRKTDSLPPIEVRATDIDPQACKGRYDTYLAEYQNVQRLGKRFDYTEIDANGSKDQVEKIIESKYSQLSIYN